jgi:hypothetical protein
MEWRSRLEIAGLFWALLAISDVTMPLWVHPWQAIAHTLIVLVR